MVKVGDTVVREPVTFSRYDEDLKKHTKAAMRGKVVYVHPEGRYHTVDVREKLVELLCKMISPTITVGEQADFLIAHGVTVQEWISVKDRLPEIVSTHKRYRSTIKKSIRVLCVCVQKSGKTMVKEGCCEWYNDYPEPCWQIPGTIDEVTHWQYLPQPPKGE